MNPCQCDNLLKILSPLLTFIVGFLTALFAEPLRQLIYRPVWNRSLRTMITASQRRMKGFPAMHRAHYIRVKVTNRRSRVAKDCRAYLVGMEREVQLEPGVYGRLRGAPARMVDNMAGRRFPKDVPRPWSPSRERLDPFGRRRIASRIGYNIFFRRLAHIALRCMVQDPHEAEQTEQFAQGTGAWEQRGGAVKHAEGGPR